MAREIQQYTESQLAREIQRTAVKAADFVAMNALDDEDFTEFRRYFHDLRHEDARRAKIHGAARSRSAAPTWDINLPKGNHLRTERVA